MSGTDKLFIHLEPIIMREMSTINARDLAHLAYAYSIRSAGNPELYTAFD